MMQTTKDLLKTTYSHLLWRSGALRAWLRLRPGRLDPVVLTYHDVEPEPFEDHLACLLRRYRVVSLDDCCRHVAAGEPVPPNSLILTFDDGYASFARDIHPVLERHGVPATVFVTTDAADTGTPLWMNRVRARLGAVEAETIAIGGRSLALAGRRTAAAREAIDHLNRQTLAERGRMLAALFDGREPPADGLERYRPLSWDAMRAMGGLVTFGSHTRSHPCLSRLSRAEAEAEIAGSKARLEAMLGVPARHFAYPFGTPESYGAETVELVEAAGYESAVTIARGACRRGDPRFELRRMPVDPRMSGREVAARLSGLWLFLTT